MKKNLANNLINHSYPSTGSEEHAAIIRVLRSNFLAEGEEVSAFEEEMAEYIGLRYAMAVNSGTGALHCALLALGIKAGDEVVVPNYVCRSVLNAVQYVMAKPVVCDVDRHTFNITAELAKKKISRKTKAVIVAHMFGCPADIRGIKRLGFPVIEDCAQSIGAEYYGKRVGSVGDISVFSFEGTKPITTGEGGMVLSGSADLYRKLKRLKEPYKKDNSPKYTYRMSSLQAAVGRVQLRKLSGFILRRRHIAEEYLRTLNLPGMELPFIPENCQHMFHRFVITLRNGRLENFMKECLSNGIMVKRPIKPYVLNQYLGISDRLFENTRFIMGHCASVPIYPALNKRQVKRVIKTLRKAYLNNV